MLAAQYQSGWAPLNTDVGWKQAEPFTTTRGHWLLTIRGYFTIYRLAWPRQHRGMTTISWRIASGGRNWLDNDSRQLQPYTCHNVQSVSKQDYHREPLTCVCLAFIFNVSGERRFLKKGIVNEVNEAWSCLYDVYLSHHLPKKFVTAPAYGVLYRLWIQPIICI